MKTNNSDLVCPYCGKVLFTAHLSGEAAQCPRNHSSGAKAWIVPHKGEKLARLLMLQGLFNEPQTTYQELCQRFDHRRIGGWDFFLVPLNNG